ncbi:hypothetical protein ABVT39_021354 [Epinephelus coioides]
MDKTKGNHKTTISETTDSSGNMAVKAAVAQWDSRPTVTGGEALQRPMMAGLPLFYREVLSAQAEFLQHTNYVVHSVILVKELLIFLNKYIKKNDKLMCNVKMLRAGIVQLKDIMYEFLPGFLPTQAIFDSVKEVDYDASYRTVSNYYEAIQECIPCSWKALINSNVVGDRAAACCLGISLQVQRSRYITHMVWHGKTAAEMEAVSRDNAVAGPAGMAVKCGEGDTVRRAGGVTGVKDKAAEKSTEHGGGRQADKMAAAGVPTANTAAGRDTPPSKTRELVALVEVEGETAVTMLDLLRAVEQTCGRVMGCRAKGANKWELTMSNPKGKQRLMDGFKIKDCRIIASEIARDQPIVSFLNLPLYTTDEQIIDKLRILGGRAGFPN